MKPYSVVICLDCDNFDRREKQQQFTILNHEEKSKLVSEHTEATGHGIYKAISQPAPPDAVYETGDPMSTINIAFECTQCGARFELIWGWKGTEKPRTPTPCKRCQGTGSFLINNEDMPEYVEKLRSTVIKPKVDG